jgi:hypothetical protein
MKIYIKRDYSMANYIEREVSVSISIDSILYDFKYFGIRRELF